MRMTSLNTLINYDSVKVTQQTTSFKKNNIVIHEEDSGEGINELSEYTDNILSSIENLISELEDISDNIQEQACEHINDNDTILTANHSDQLLDFFKEASSKKTFKVIIAESAPSLKYLFPNITI
jgi:translation initiation factor 2B subunit (eIF-2B alpha/beta/delta family)